MPVKINNIDSTVGISGNGKEGALPPGEIERIVRIVMERIRDEQTLQSRIDTETEINNNVSKSEFFD